jgi:hypothetical protein
MPSTTSTLTIRVATTDDVPALYRLALLDSSRVPSGMVLLGEVDGDLWAALSVDDGHAVADPFRPSADIVRALRIRVRELHSSRAAARRPSRLVPAAA